MVQAPPKRRAAGACVALASILTALTTSPALAQSGTGTTEPAGTQAAPAKPGAGKPKPGPKPGESPPAGDAAEQETQQNAPAEKKSDPEPDAAAAAKKEEDEEQKEAWRAIFVSADMAFTRVDLGGISDNLSFDKPSANGLLYGFAMGLRLKDIRFGARWRVHSTTEFDIWSVAGSVGYGLPLRPLSPIFTATVGYVWDQKIDPGVFSSSLPRGTVLPPDVNVSGLLVGLDLNASYWVTQFLRLGAFIGTDFMFLTRDRAPLPQSIFPIDRDTQEKALYSDTGSGVAYTINIGLRGAFDIGF